MDGDHPLRSPVSRITSLDPPWCGKFFLKNHAMPKGLRFSIENRLVSQFPSKSPLSTDSLVIESTRRIYSTFIQDAIIVVIFFFRTRSADLKYFVHDPWTMKLQSLADFIYLRENLEKKNRKKRIDRESIPNKIVHHQLKKRLFFIIFKNYESYEIFCLTRAEIFVTSHGKKFFKNLKKSHNAEKLYREDESRNPSPLSTDSIT